MWIRSQDKTKLVDVKNVMITEIDYAMKVLQNYIFVTDQDKNDKQTYYITTFTDINESTLGEYSTKEKALKVLDLIQKYIGGMQEQKIIKEADDYYSITSKYDIPFNYCKDGIFQMPEDNKI